MKTALQCGAVILCLCSSTSTIVRGQDDGFVVESNCDGLTLVIDRTFTADCEWSVSAEVEQDENEVAVVLQIAAGSSACDDAETTVTFEVSLGSFSQGEYDVSVTWVEDESSSDRSLFGEPTEEGPVSIAVVECAFLRGDADNNGSTSALVDAIYLLKWAFLDGVELPCLDAADVDDSGDVVAIPDALYLLRYGFLEGPAPPEPFADRCGFDPTEDDIGCAVASEECADVILLRFTVIVESQDDSETCGADLAMTIIRDEDTLEDVWGSHFNEDQPDVDFDEDMVIAITRNQTSSGYLLQIDEVVVRGDEVVVRYTFTKPPLGCATDLALTCAYSAVQCPATVGDLVTVETVVEDCLGDRP